MCILINVVSPALPSADLRWPKVPKDKSRKNSASSVAHFRFSVINQYSRVSVFNLVEETKYQGRNPS